MPRIEWTYTVETSRPLRALAVLGLGAVGSIFVFLAVGLVLVVGGSLLAGEYAIIGLVLAFTLLFGRRLASQAALFRTDVPNVTDYLPARSLLAASVGWAVFLGALLAVDASSELAYAVIVLAVFVSLPLVAFLRSDGYVDTDEGVVVVDNTGGSGRDATLAEIDEVRRYDLRGIAVLRIRYHDGTGSSAPRLLTVPAASANDVQAALESSDEAPPESDRNPLIAKTLYAFALGSLALAAAFGYFAWTVDGDAAGVGAYVAIFAGVFGLLFAWLGAVEG